MDLPSFLIGIVVAWIVALLVYWFQWQRSQRQEALTEASMIRYGDHLARLQAGDGRIAELEAELQALRSTCDDEKAALQAAGQEEREQLSRQLAELQEEVQQAQQRLQEPQNLAPAAPPALEPPPSPALELEAAPEATAAYDDLQRVEGIGPKIEGLLQAAGIHSFLQLADADTERIQQILTAAGERYRLADPQSWAEQARLAAAGRWDELQALQDQLKGGREAS